MHPRFLLLPVCLALLGVSAVAIHAAAPAAPRTLRVLSYNIHHGEGDDGKLDLPRLAAVITASGADLVALQEVDQKTQRTGGIDQAAELARLTGLRFAYGKAMDYQGGAYGQALLSRWPLEEFAVHPLPNPANVEPRIAISATVRPPGLPPLRFIGTHLDATRDDTARWQQALRLNELFAHDALPTIFAGDFNARPDTRVMTALFEHFTDASAATPAPTSPAKQPTGRIDYVLLRPAGAWRVVSSTVLPEAVASDHRPLLVELGSARAASTEPFFFIQLSDPQLGMFTDNKDFTQDAANFEFAVAAVNRLRPAFVVITGDLVHKPGDAAQIAEYRRIAGKIDAAIPVYHIAGNHDVQNVPTPASIAAYEKIFGPDRYTFSHRSVTGIVLNSSVIHSPQESPQQLAEQEQWLRTELTKAKAAGTPHIVVFQHHPWFIANAAEPDQYFNIPLARRAAYMALFREFGVRYLFCGHYHRNAEGRDGEIQNITSGPVGKPLGGAKSGLRVAIVRDAAIEHRYYELGELPVKIDLTPPTPPPAAKKK